MQELITEFEKTYKKPQVALVRSGNTVRVHQRISEGGKERVQTFEGVVIRARRRQSLTSAITVRRVSSGVGVEKTFLLHSPNVTKVEVLQAGKVRRNYLSYLRQRQGKSARLRELEFDRAAANVAEPEAVEKAETADGDKAVAADAENSESAGVTATAGDADPKDNPSSKTPSK